MVKSFKKISKHAFEKLDTSRFAIQRVTVSYGITDRYTKYLEIHIKILDGHNGCYETLDMWITKAIDDEFFKCEFEDIDVALFTNANEVIKWIDKHL